MNSIDKITYTLSQKKAFDLNRHISVTAGAGSGKTAVLVNRYLKILLEEGVRVNEIVAITFTEKAAAELKNRIVQDVSELIEQGEIKKGKRENGRTRRRDRDWKGISTPPDYLLEVKEQLTSANIMTIHSFCAKILREFPVEAGVDASFSVLQGIEQRLTLQDAIVETLKEIAFRPDDDADKENLATLLRIIGRNELQIILGRLVDKRDVVEKLLARLYSKSDEELIQYWNDFIENESRKKFMEKFPIEDWIANLESVLTIAKGKNARPVASLVDELKRLEKLDEQIQIVKDILPLILTKSGAIGKQGFLGRAADTASVEHAIEFLVNASKEIGNTPYPNDDDKFLIGVSRKIFNLYRKVLAKYELKKVLAGQLDFEDLQLKVKSLLENEPIRKRLAERYKYIMVDEYQDTNRLQYDILKPLVSDFQTGNLFIVGDPKQCLPPEALILTDRGKVPICEIQVGDRILSCIGRGVTAYFPVSNVFKSHREDNVVRIKTRAGYEVETTALHKMFVYVEHARTNLTTGRIVIYADLCSVSDSRIRRYSGGSSKGQIRHLNDIKPLHQVSLETRDSNVVEKLKSVGYDLKETSHSGHPKIQGYRLRKYFSDYTEAREFAAEVAQLIDANVVERFKPTDGKAKLSLIVSACNIQPGYYIPIYDEEKNEVIYDEVIDVRKGRREDDFYDLEVYPVHNFIARNVVVHNSIYGFRNADVRVFEKTKGEIVQQTTDKDFALEGETLESDEMERRGEIHLADNFRLLYNLVDFINLVFSRIMGSGVDSEFHVEYEPLIKGRANDEPGSVELILTPYSVKLSAGSPANKQAACSTEEEIIARRIKRLIADKQQIWKRDTETGQEISQPAKYGDIAILLRSRTNLKLIESALEKYDIPYIVTGGIGFYQSQEIYDIYNYLQFLLTPQDDVALAGILRAPFFGLSDAQLYEISAVVSDSADGVDKDAKTELVNFWDKLQRYAIKHPDDNRIQKTVELLNEHLSIADRIPLTSLIRRILNDTAAIGVFAYGPRGEQNLANYEKLLDVVREFEKSDFCNLFDFMERLKILINEEPREGQAPTEVSENAVQIMTIHAAKGLEFPIVILPYIDRGFKYDSPPYIDDALGLGFQPAHPDRNYQKSEPAITEIMKARSGSKTEAEEKRIFYVATTRARDMLILSGRVSEKRNKPNWMNWLLDALDLDGIPPEDERRNIKQIIRNVGGRLFPIRIIRSADEIELVEEEPEPEPEVIEIPEIAIESLSDEPTGEMLSEAHFITCAQCPTKYYLKYHLGMPETDIFSDEINSLKRRNHNGTTTNLLDVIVHEVLKRVKTPEPKFEVIEGIIDKLLTPHSELNSAEVRELRYAAEKHVYNFLTSELAQKAISSPEIHCEYTIVAKLGENFVTGTMDRLFKNDAGEYEVVGYKTYPIDDSEYATQMELYAMLVLKLFHEQQSVTTTIFFTHSGSSYSSRYGSDQLAEIEQKYLENIEQISSGKFEKNTSHCFHCPYAEDGTCIL